MKKITMSIMKKITMRRKKNEIKCGGEIRRFFEAVII